MPQTAKTATKKKKKTDEKIAKKRVKSPKSGGGEGARKKYGDLTKNDMRVLACLSNGKQMTRAEMKDETGIQKGWSKLLGAPTRTIASTSLEGRGYVRSEKHETQGEGDDKTRGGFFYKITASGKQALAKAEKEREKAEAEAVAE